MVTRALLYLVTIAIVALAPPVVAGWVDGNNLMQALGGAR